MNDQPSLRQTGRTTRMLRSLIEAQQQDTRSRHVVVVGSSASIPYMRNLYLSLGGDPSRVSFVNSDSRRIMQGRRKQDIYYDHYYFELEAERAAEHRRRMETAQPEPTIWHKDLRKL